MSARSDAAPASADTGWQVAECLLPGLTTAIAQALCERVRAEQASCHRAASFFGSLLMPDDEVLLCLFAGPLGDVRQLCERAGLPYERIVPCQGLGWANPNKRGDTEDE